MISCNDESVDSSDSIKQQTNVYSDHNKSVDTRATDIIYRSDLTKIELLDLYIELSDVDDEIVRSNSKNLVLFYLVRDNFVDTASLSDIELLIKDQSKQWSNIATVGINYRLFNRALDLDSSLDIPKFEKDFRIKNEGKIYDYYKKEDQEMIQYLQQGMFFQMRINLMNKS